MRDAIPYAIALALLVSVYTLITSMRRAPHWEEDAPPPAQEWGDENPFHDGLTPDRLEIPPVPKPPKKKYAELPADAVREQPWMT